MRSRNVACMGNMRNTKCQVKSRWKDSKRKAGVEEFVRQRVN
jgi:hypothetical protein